MMRPLSCFILISLSLAACDDVASVDAPVSARSPIPVVEPTAAPEPLPDLVRVRLETGEGPIVVALNARRAPVTTANFVRYVDQGRFDGTSFYRAAATRDAGGEAIAGRGFIQGGIRRSARRALPPIAHEPTSATGLSHEAGTISMARTETGAMGEFFITTTAMTSMDSKGSEEGYAAFGKVVEGMDTVRRILAAETVPGAGRGAMRGQMIAKPVRIVKAARVQAAAN